MVNFGKKWKFLCFLWKKQRKMKKSEKKFDFGDYLLDSRIKMIHKGSIGF